MRRRRAVEVRIDAPIGGLNTRDSIDQLPPTDAIVLDNIIPDLGKVRVRPGMIEHTDSDDIGGHTPGNVETLMVYKSATAEELLAADGGIIYDISVAETPTEITGGSGFNSNRWQWANFGGLMVMVNSHASDSPQWYNGSEIATLTLTGSGLTANNVVGCHVFKRRVYYWEDGSQDFWYSDIDTLGGALTKFPLSYVGTFGGYLVSMATWTYDGGSGPDDYAVFFMSSGEAIVYQGYSPSAVGDWALVGIYDVGFPLSVRGSAKFGGDLLLMTSLDFVSLQQVLQGKETKITRSKASGMITDVVANYRDNWGWEVVVYPKDKLLIFNIPVTTNTTAYQLVMNLSTGAWCRFKGWNANTFIVYKDDLYFGGGDGHVFQAFAGKNDNDAAIEAEVQTSWMDFGDHANKKFSAVKNLFKDSSALATYLDVKTDFDLFPIVSFPSPTGESGTPWGSPWGSSWSGGTSRVVQDWQTLSAHGRMISMRILMSAMQSREWYGMIWLLEKGQRI
jgi:hypothetical protein